MDVLRYPEEERKYQFIYLYLIDDEQGREEIAECEIDNTQVIRFLKASKLEFNFLEKVIEKQL